MNEKTGIKVVLNCDINKLKEYTKNPRNNDLAVESVARSIEKFGFINPIIVDKDYQICCGHTRYKAAKQNGLKKVSVLIVPYLKDDLFKAFNIADNQTAQIAEWNEEELARIVAELKDSDFDIETLGFDERYLENLESLIEEDLEGNSEPDDIPEIPKKAKTKKGDIWILGNHRLMCGDSTLEDDVSKLMNGEKASLFSTDPPYCVDYTGANRPNGGKDWSGEYHEVDIIDAVKFYEDFYTVGMKFVKDHTAFYLWHASSRRIMVENVCKSLGLLIHQQIVWVKPCAIMTYSMYMWRHEPCLLMWVKGQKPHYNPKKMSIGTIWPIDYSTSDEDKKLELYTSVWELNWEGKNRNPGIEHPTVKPTEVFAIPMRMHTKKGDICYEPFSGSGSQIIAGEIVGRSVYAMELEPVFCDVAVQRWEEFTGKKAKLQKSKKGN